MMLLHGLDAFGHYVQPEAVGKLDDCGDDARLGGR